MKFWKNGFDFQKIKLEGSQQCQSNPSIPLNPCELLETPPTFPMRLTVTQLTQLVKMVTPHRNNGKQ